MTAEQSLAQRYQRLRRHDSNCAEHTPLLSAHGFAQAGLIRGEVQGNRTPSVLLVALEPGHWEYSREDKLDRPAYDLLAWADCDWPVFAYLRDDRNTRCYSLFDGSDGTRSVDEMHSIELIRDYEKPENDSTFRWSMRICARLMHRFDAFHEQVFQTVKGRVNAKNDIVEEVAKLHFLETFRVHDGEELSFADHEGETRRFRAVCDYRYVAEHGAHAVKRIQAAFEVFKAHDDDVVVSDDGTRNPRFPPDSHPRLSQPGNDETLLEAMQNLGPVTDNHGRAIAGKEQGTLADVAGDLLRRAFDEFRFCEPTCGAFGFGSVALRHSEIATDRLGGMSKTRKAGLKRTPRDTAFTGADAAPRGVMLAHLDLSSLADGSIQSRIAEQALHRLVPAGFEPGRLAERLLKQIRDVEQVVPRSGTPG